MEGVNLAEAMRSTDWRMKTIYRIKNKDKVTVNFTPNPAQLEIEHTIRRLTRENKPIRIIVLKPRQIGGTTYFCIRNFDQTYWHKNQFTAVVAHKDKKADEIFGEIVKFCYDNLPDYLKFKAKHDNVRQLEWRNIHSQIIVTNDGHGITPNRLHLTEVAHIKNAKTVITEALPGVPKKGWVIQESTANGRNNYFCDTWEESYHNKSSQWTPIFLKWWKHNEYSDELPENFLLDEEEENLYRTYKIDGLTLKNLAWRRNQIDLFGGIKVDPETGLTGKLAFMQNYPMNPEEAFILPHGSMFDISALHLMSLAAKEPIYRKQIGHGWLRVWEEKENEEEYLIACDPSYGEAGSYSSVSVFRKHDCNIVATLHGKYGVELAKHLYDLGRFYNGALVAVERNTGQMVLNELLNHFAYGNIYFHLEFDEKRKKIRRPGFPTNTVTRNMILGYLEDAIVSGSITIQDKAAINECLNFGNVKGKWKAMSGNDDRVFSMAIGVYLCRQSRASLAPPDITVKPSGL